MSEAEEKIWSSLRTRAYTLARTVQSGKHRVGAAAFTSKKFTAVGVSETKFNLLLCAESSLVSNLISNGGGKLEKIVLIDSNSNLIKPCRKCQQLLSEYLTPDSQILLDSGVVTVKTLTT